MRMSTRWWVAPVLLAAAFLGEAGGALAGKSPFLSRAKLREITAGDWTVSSAKIREQLGWRPEVMLVERVGRTAEWYRAAGWV